MPPKHALVSVEENVRPPSPTSAKELEGNLAGIEADEGSNPDSDAESDSRYLAERFGALLSISADSLENLASRIRRKSWSEETTTAGADSNDCRLVSRLNGSYNLIHVVEFTDSIKYVIRVPLTAREGRFDEKARQEMRVHALTLRYIRTKTGLQVPEVLHFDITDVNEIGAPYIAMSFLEGIQVSEKWFRSDSGDSRSTHSLNLASLRHRILDSVAEAMSKLRDLEFDKIGSIQFSDDAADDFHVGPCYYWDEGDLDDDDYGLCTTIKEFGPFSSSRDFLMSFIERDSAVATPFLLCSTEDDGYETSVLSPPDFDTQNFLIDDEGNVTGILDWDTVHTVPRYVGYAIYPGWITRDWDPLMYDHPSETENTPEQLESFRRHYDNQMYHLLGGDGDYKFMPKAHIFENVVLAIKDSGCRSHIVHKILTKIFAEEDDEYSYSVIESVGRDELEADVEEVVKNGFQSLLSI